MTKIITNKIKIDYFDYDKFSNEYSIFKINFAQRKKYDFIDMFVDINSIRSTCFTNKLQMYLLVDKNRLTTSELRKITEEKGLNDISFEVVSAKGLDESIIIQLLINSLHSSKNERLRSSNLGGKYWLTVKHNEKQIQVLEFDVTSDMLIKLNIRTLTSRKCSKYLSFKKGKSFDSYPQYICEKGRVLRCFDDNKNTYIVRQFNNKKTSQQFLGYLLDNFNDSKIGMLAEMLNRFDKRFSTIIRLGFENYEEIYHQNFDRADINIKKSILREKANNVGVQIIDYVNDDKSLNAIKNIKQSLIEYGFNVAEDADIVIYVINEKDLYEEDKDPYINLHKDIVQCVVIQNQDKFLNGKTSGDEVAISSFVAGLASQILIKSDIKKGEVSIFDWNKLIGRPLTFITRENDGEEYVFNKLHISEKGKLLFEKQSEYNVDDNIQEVFEDNCLLGLIIDSQNIIRIYKTDLFTIPNINEIEINLANGINLKVKNSRDAMSSMTDIRFFKINDDVFYFSGDISTNMSKSGASNSFNIYKVKSDSELDYEFYCSMLTEIFVKTNSKTVIPFPFKYLREYYKSETMQKNNME